MSILPLKLLMIILFTLAAFGMTAIAVAMFSGMSYIPKNTIDYTKAYLSADEANRIIDQQLESLLEKLPKTSTVRIAQIREQGMGKMIPFLRYKATNTASRNQVATAQTLPLSQWKTFLPDLIDDKCVVIKPDTIVDQAYRERLEAAHTKLAVVCPLNAEGYLFGALFVSWRQADDYLPDQDMPLIVKTADKITAYLEIAQRD